MKKNKLTTILILLFGFISNSLIAQEYKFESVPGDPLNARIYTLKNGLKVFMSVYKDEPRIQTNIAVRVGSKNDPKETTGLAHYFEHMMFKGTPNFGTQDWSEEQPMIMKIDSLFEVYRNETDQTRRAAIYHIIDSVSYEASKIAIPNEYDKMMTAIGSQGTNASTGNDVTQYQENIPSNQLENWALIEAERFEHPVLRIFHTELETVYEEKNMTLTRDSEKARDLLMKGLFPNHPYGQQTTIGEAEHLKNPSMKNIREFYSKYYVPNNIAIAMAGDFNPDEAIKIIDKYFGRLVPKEVPQFTFQEEEPITTPKEFEVVGLEAENISIGFRFKGANSDDAMMADLLATILFNGKAGLLDLNINKKQLTLGVRANAQRLTDYTVLNLSGRNKGGQSLEEVKKLLLDQVELLKNGQFPDWMLTAAINNMKLREMTMYESNNGRTRTMYMSFINRIEWKDIVNTIPKYEKVTKDQLVNFAKVNLKDNFVVVYKKKGKPQDVAKVQKPPITPIFLNRNVESDFLKKIKSSEVKQIAPVFIDYDKDIQRVSLDKGVEILYKQNTENKTFNLVYYYEFGSNSDPVYVVAAQFLQLLGTNKYSAEELGQEFYNLACTFSVNVLQDEIRVSVSGLSENAEKAIALMEEILNNPKPDKGILDTYVENILKERNNAKLVQANVFSGAVAYATFGDKSSFTNILPNDQLKTLDPDKLTSVIKSLMNYPHKVIFYGPDKIDAVKKLMGKYHKIGKQLLPIPAEQNFVELETNSNRVVFAHYEAKQSYLQTISKGVTYSDDLLPFVRVYNDYFGGGMNAIVFQELREKRGLAYTARSTYNIPNDPTKPFMNTSMIATQNDKVVDAFNAFNELFNQMPESEAAFNLSKKSLISDIQTQRITKMNLIWNYLSAQKMGYKTDIRKSLYEKIPSISLADIKKWQEQYIKGKPKTYVILGKESDMDFNKLQEIYGPVTKITLDQIFGY